MDCGDAGGKEPACQCRRHKRCRVDPWVGKIPWRRAWQSTSVFLPGESHGQRRLAGYSPWGCKELDTTEVTQQQQQQQYCNPPGSSVHRISQGRILQWVATSFSRRSSWSWNDNSFIRTFLRVFGFHPTICCWNTHYGQFNKINE